MPVLLLHPALWVIGPLALVLGVLALRRLHRGIVERLGRLAARRGGRLLAEPWYTTPRVEWTTGGVRLTLSVRGEAEEARRSGQRAFVHVASAGYPPLELELVRAEHAGPDAEPLGTRGVDFERAFRAVTDDPRRARELVDGELRHALCAFAPEHDLRVRLGQGAVFRDGLWRHRERERRLEVSVHGLPEDGGVLEALVKLARGLHEHLERHGARRAA